MKSLWPTEALEFQASVTTALERLGGIDFTRACESDPSLRAAELEPVIARLSFDDLDPARDPVAAAAAALGVRAAGAVVCPWPLVQRLAVPSRMRAGADAIYLVDRSASRLEHLDVAGRALALDVRDGRLWQVEPMGPPAAVPLDPFGVPCRLGGPVADEPGDVFGISAVLTAFWVLGALDRVLEQVAEYARDRHQFGRPIALFGAIQWRLSDVALAHDGLGEMAAFTLLRLMQGRASVADVLALRLTTLESAESVLSNGHQILGAIGLCEEHDVTVIDRHLQPVLRRPTGVNATTSLLTRSIERLGFDAIYGIPPAAPAPDGNGHAPRREAPAPVDTPS